MRIFRQSGSVVLFCLGVLTPFFAFADALHDSSPDSPLTLWKGDGAFGIDSQFKQSTEFFDSSGDKQGTFADGSQLKFYDLRFFFQAAYGLTDRLSVWLEFPVMYRKESRFFNGEDSGLGDVKAGARYSLWKSSNNIFEFAGGLYGKFPSGETDVKIEDPTRGLESELPLGTGSFDLTPEVHGKQHLGKRFSLQESVSYTFRFDSVVNFLRTGSVPIAANDGTVFLLPIGNLNVDWGDELQAKGRLAYAVTDWLTLTADLHYLYRRTTKLRGFDISVNAAGTIEATPSEISLNRAYVIYARPSVLINFLEHWTLRTGVEIPVLGDSFPTLPIAESLIGNTYQLEVRYAF